MDHSDTLGPPARRPGVRTWDVLIAAALLGGWIALQAWILPAMGVQT